MPARSLFHLLLPAILAAGTTAAQPAGPDGFTVIAIGDAGEAGSVLRGNARLIVNMATDQHDAGPFDMLVFLGDNFYDTGLNVPADEVEGYVKRILGPYRGAFDLLGRTRVHAVPGNHEYYARNALNTSVLFGLVSINAIPVGHTGRGNDRARELPQWTYHDVLPGRAVFPLTPGAADSVEFIFVDSALPLRTEPSAWTPALDSLRRLLRSGGEAPGRRWRVLAMHHPLATVGEHGGYSDWDDVKNSVAYLTPCDKDSNAVAWMKNWFDPQDLCADRYRAYADSLRSAVADGGVPIHLVLSGHDHSLQLLHRPALRTGCPSCPEVQIVSGAGSKPSRVKFPSPPADFTSAQTRPSKEGESTGGFVRLTFTADEIRAVFYEPTSMAPLDMGGGKKQFRIGRDGRLKIED